LRKLKRLTFPTSNMGRRWRWSISHPRLPM
jgi:hypothetical protein